jgi:hypothetical protein
VTASSASTALGFFNIPLGSSRYLGDIRSNLLGGVPMALSQFLCSVRFTGLLPCGANCVAKSGFVRKLSSTLARRESPLLWPSVPASMRY